MSKRPHSDDLRAVGKLAVDATKRVTALVEAMHREIASGPNLLGRPLQLPVRLFTSLVYGGVQLSTDLVGAGVDSALATFGPLLGESKPGTQREVARSVLNGVIGDYLHATHNPLAIDLALRISVPPNNGKLLVLLHGSAMADSQWLRGGHDHGRALAETLGCGLAYVHYNSGRHISDNGALLAHALQDLEQQFDQQFEQEPAGRQSPVGLREIVLIGFSMGGLVARSAIHLASEQGWRRKLSTLVTIGSPHHGAPLERGGQWVHSLIGVSRYSAPIAQLARIRGAGVTDLRFGTVREEDWRGRDRFAFSHDDRTPLPLPSDVRCFAIAGGPRGDGLVPVDSALGRNKNEKHVLSFADTHVVDGVNHLDLLSDQRVYEWVKARC